MKKSDAIDRLTAMAAKAADATDREALSFAACVLASGQEPKPKLTHEVCLQGRAYRFASAGQAARFSEKAGLNATEVKEIAK